MTVGSSGDAGLGKGVAACVDGAGVGVGEGVAVSAEMFDSGVAATHPVNVTPTAAHNAVRTNVLSMNFLIRDRGDCLRQRRSEYR